MNLKEIRDAMFAQADYSPNSSPEAITRVNGFINRAYNTLALEAPFLFFESKVQLVTEPDVKSKAGDPDNGVFDKVQLVGNHTLPAGVSADAWTWRTTYSLAVQQALPDKFTLWDYSRGWDGRMIDIIEDAVESAPSNQAAVMQANALKYLLRLWHKENPVQDAEKAQWYLNRLINLLK